MDYKFKDDFVREYGYDKVICKINKELKEMFEQRKKEPERNINIRITLANGKKIMLNELPKFNVVEISAITK